MAIVSPDTYISQLLKDKTRALLSKCYIMKEVLKDFDSEVRDNFLQDFCGENPKLDVNISYTFPQSPLEATASYVVQLGNSNENGSSLGNILGSYEGEEGDENSVQLEIQEAEDYLFFEFPTELASMPISTDLQFSGYDNVTLDKNLLKMRKDGNEHLVGNYYTFFYIEHRGDSKGSVKGFEADESVVVIPLSNSIDTARCLDAVLKMILIMSRENLEEQNVMKLQNLTFGDMAPVYDDGERPIFGRPVTIRYQVTHSIDYTIAREITELLFKTRGGYTDGKEETNS